MNEPSLGLILLGLVFLITVLPNLLDRPAKPKPEFFHEPPYIIGKSLGGTPIVRLGRQQEACLPADQLKKYYGIDLDALPTCDYYGRETTSVPTLD